MSLYHFRDPEFVGLEHFRSSSERAGLLRPVREDGGLDGRERVLPRRPRRAPGHAAERPMRGRALFRTLLILPWAMPQYISALTWRGMFNYEYGAVNLILSSGSHLPAVPWLSDPDRGLRGADHHQHLARLPVHDGDRPGRAPVDPARALRGGATSTAPTRWQQAPPRHPAAAEAGAGAGHPARHDLDLQQPERDLAGDQRRRARRPDAHPGHLRLQGGLHATTATATPPPSPS